MLTRLAAIDELTVLPNRRGFDASVSSDLERARSDTKVAIAHALQRAGGDGARLGRFGGEEFSMARVDIDPQSRNGIGARLRRPVKRLAMPHGAVPGRPYVTISIGLAWGPMTNNDVRPLVQLADQALYEAKSHERNRVVVRARNGDLMANPAMSMATARHRLVVGAAVSSPRADSWRRAIYADNSAIGPHALPRRRHARTRL